MSTYAIGDVQGCYDELEELLQLIHFNPSQDQLWFAGDLVNRGPKSLEVLRLVKRLKHAIVILGNHDLHLLALANGHPYKEHSLYEVLNAPDATEIINWLRAQPLLHYDAQLGYVMTHAGIPPHWTLEQAQSYAIEVETMLRSDRYPEFLEHLYSRQPVLWHDNLAGWDRLRFIVDAFTRMRFCNANGDLDLNAKGGLDAQPAGYMPWFSVPDRVTRNTKIIFGHWAALEGKTHTANVFALDTGCVWGGRLTAMRLEDQQLFSVKAHGNSTISLPDS